MSRSTLYDSWLHCVAIRKEPKHFSNFDYYYNLVEFHAVFNDDDHAIITVYKNNNTIFAGKKIVLITFRGTKDASAWRSNFDVYPLKDDKPLLKDGKWGKGTIHDGFYTSWSRLKDEIVECVKPYLNNDNYNIICTGHSRGGALAILCGRHLIKNENSKDIMVYAFGTPKQGNAEYVIQMQKYIENGLNIIRIINGYDIVPELPPDELGFRHVGMEIKLSQPAWHRWFKFMRIFDHRYESYTKAIKKHFSKVSD